MDLYTVAILIERELSTVTGEVNSPGEVEDLAQAEARKRVRVRTRPAKNVEGTHG